MRQNFKNNPNIKLGNVDLPDDWDNPRNLKWRITCWIDGDIYDELRRRARKGEGNGKYQTLMNDILRLALFADEAIEPAVSVSQLKGLVKDLERGYNPFAKAKKAKAKPKRKAKER